MAKLKQKESAYLHRDKFATRAQTLAKLINLLHFEKKIENIELKLSSGRICSEDIFSKNTLPICRAAGADGVAVRYSDFENGIPDFSNWIEGQDYVAADMGDDFDDKFDTVLWIEDFQFSIQGKIIAITPSEKVFKGHLVKQRGAMLQKDELVLRKGDIINQFRLGLLASAGIKNINVYKKPVIAYIPSGNELVMAGSEVKRGENIESNSLMVEYMLQQWGAETEIFPIVKDEKSELEKVIDKALKIADIILLNGGSSMGTEDYSSSLLAEKSEYLQHGVRSIPGIPVAVAVINGKPVVNLPGPPFAAWCTLDWCVKGLISNYYGREFMPRLKVNARLKKSIQKPLVHEMYVRLKLEKAEEGYYALPISDKMRYSEIAINWNALFIAPIGKEKWEIGEIIEVELLDV